MTLSDIADAASAIPAIPAIPAITAITAELDRLKLGSGALGPMRVVQRRPRPGPASEIAAWIEHTLLKPAATATEIRKLCEEARHYGFRGVCVNPVYVGEASNHLHASGVSLVSVVGFPLGASCSSIKAREAELAVLHGADEIDMVLAVGWLKDRRYAEVYDDIRQVVRASAPAPVKVIIETALLTQDEKVAASAIAVRAGAAFVKTSTGFASGGATVDDVRLIRATVGDTAGIKAAGGIKTAAFARALIDAGATRLGCSASIAIVSDPD